MTLVGIIAAALAGLLIGTLGALAGWYAGLRALRKWEENNKWLTDSFESDQEDTDQ